MVPDAAFLDDYKGHLQKLLAGFDFKYGQLVNKRDCEPIGFNHLSLNAHKYAAGEARTVHELRYPL